MQHVNLILDTGNTFHKLAVMDINNTLLEEMVVSDLAEGVVDELIAKYAPSKAIISSTRGDAAQSAMLLTGRVPFVLCLST